VLGFFWTWLPTAYHCLVSWGPCTLTVTSVAVLWAWWSPTTCSPWESVTCFLEIPPHTMLCAGCCLHALRPGATGPCTYFKPPTTVAAWAPPMPNMWVWGACSRWCGCVVLRKNTKFCQHFDGVQLAAKCCQPTTSCTLLQIAFEFCTQRMTHNLHFARFSLSPKTWFSCKWVLASKPNPLLHSFCTLLCKINTPQK
jgi:hypothetical protein